MKVMITGATGFVGRYAVRALVDRGEQVRALVRTADDIGWLEDLGVELFVGDIQFPETLEGIGENVDRVVHLAGILGGAAVPESAYWDVNALGPEALLRHLVAHQMRQFVHCSTTGVVGPVSVPPADETSPCHPSNLYEETKCEGERRALAVGKELGIPVVSIRPGMIYGPGNRRLVGLLRLLEKRLMFWIDGGHTHWDCVYVEDVVQALLRALDCEQGSYESYMIAAAEPTTVREFCSMSCEIMGVGTPRLSVPRWAIWTAATVLEQLGGALGKEVVLNRSRVRFFTEHRAVCIDKAKQELGYTPQYSLAEGLREMIGWYDEQRLLG
jgi:nucleoside-diphosphate-sugar epimerase